MKNYQKFDFDSFTAPDVSFAPIYVWVWNNICTRKIIDSQLDEMRCLGIRAFYILPEPKNFRPHSMPTNLSPDYLTDGFFELCAYAVKKAEALGMRCWIYDEGGWPSGGACGRVLEEHPEYARQIIKTYEKFFSAGDVYKKSSCDVIAAFLQNNELIEDGFIFAETSVVTEYVTEKVIYGKADYPDLLNKDATEHFIKITHEKYASSMKECVGKSVTAVFTDEPKASSLSFNEQLNEKYESLYGESVLPYLPLIFGKAEVTNENVHILHRWYDLCSRMFCDNYLLECKKWSNEHGMAFTGHLDKDHDPLGFMYGGGNFNLMRALRCFDIPGVDIIWRQIYPEDKITHKDDTNAYNGFFPRYASSAAAQNGTKLAMAEIFGVAGAAITYDIMRYTAGYLAVRGINVFNLFNFPLGRKGQLFAQELPVFTRVQPFYNYLNRFNLYLERLSYLSSLSERVCQTALYYPVCDIQGGLNAEESAKKFDDIGRNLEKMIVDFDIADDDVIQSSNGIDDGFIRVGYAEYRRIIIPEGVFIPEETQKVLDRFVKGGGIVLNNPSSITPTVTVEGDGIRAMHRKADNAELFILFRESGENGDYKVFLPSSSGYLLDMVSGKLEHFDAENGILHLSLAVGETAVILLTDEEIEADEKSEYKESLELSLGFKICKENELACDENGFYIIKHSDRPVEVCLGDWSAVVGNAYSGSCVYETTFELDDDKVGRACELNLGEVHFAAQVYLNGQSLGSAFMSPYKLKIPAGILDKNNTLKVAVTNTCANWYVNTDYFDNWKTEELSPYFSGEIAYAKDFVSGGLYGPIILNIQ